MKLATLCYLRHRGHLLLLHRIKREGDLHFGRWNGLGGKLLPGESPDECVRREVREEAGLEVGPLHFAGLLTFPLFDGESDWYVYVFTASPVGAVAAGAPLYDSPEGHLAWVEESTVLTLPLWPGDRIFLPLVLRGRTFSGTFRYDRGALVGHSVELFAGARS